MSTDAAPQPLRPIVPQGANQDKKALAVTALVLSCVFFIPILPPVGLVLGIIALATGRSRTISIVAVCVGAAVTALIAIEVAIAVPAFFKYVRRAKAVEASVNVRRLADTVAAMSPQQWAALSEADWTPAGSACALPGKRYPGDAAVWQGEPWRSLGFAMAVPHHYQYRVVRDDQGFVVEARGDLDCDGRTTVVRRHVMPDGVGPESVQ